MTWHGGKTPNRHAATNGASKQRTMGKRQSETMYRISGRCVQGEHHLIGEEFILLAFSFQSLVQGTDFFQEVMREVGSLGEHSGGRACRASVLACITPSVEKNIYNPHKRLQSRQQHRHSEVQSHVPCSPQNHFVVHRLMQVSAKAGEHTHHHHESNKLTSVF